MRTLHVFQKLANERTKNRRYLMFQYILPRYYPRDHKLDRKTWQLLLKAPAPADKSKQKSMHPSEKKGDESKVRRKQASREEAKEDENLVKRNY